MSTVLKTISQVTINGQLVKLSGNDHSVFLGAPKTTTKTALEGTKISGHPYVDYSEMESKITLTLMALTPERELIETAISNPGGNTVVVYYADVTSDNFVSCSVEGGITMKGNGDGIEVIFTGVHEPQAASDSK